MKTALFLLPVLSLALAAAEPGNWPAFRGPNSSGISASAKPPAKIGPKEGVLWSVDVPWAPSSPSVWGERIFLTTFADEKLETRAYSTKDGALLWKKISQVEKFEEFHRTEGSPAAGTPATDGKHVVSYFGSFGLACFDVEGKELWQRRMPVAETQGNFGSGTSAILVDGKVILCRDVASGSQISAFDLHTGKTLWETPRVDSITSYGAPIVWEHDGFKEIVMAGSLSMKGYDPKTGEERWLLRGLPAFSCTTPVVGDGLLFYAGWSPGKADSPFPSWAATVEKQDKNHDGKISLDEFDSGPAWFRVQDVDRDGFITKADWDMIGGAMKRGENVLIAVKPGAKGEAPESQVAWKFTKGLPYVPCPLYYDGRVYLIRDGGMMSSFDAKTGKPFYSQERLPAQGSYYSSPVAADGRIYLASLQGKLTVVKAGGDLPEVVHSADFGERIAGTPALVGDRVYLRTEKKLHAFGPQPK